MRKSISVVIVDDEPLVRERISTLLSEEKDFEILAECSDGNEAVAVINRLNPQVIFLDVQMPEKDGFGVLRNIDPKLTPIIVFITAYSDFALDAFENHALDYLLKPIDSNRFSHMLDEVRRRTSQSQLAEVGSKFNELLKAEHPPSDEPYVSRLAVKEDKKITLVKTSDIDWIEADGNYVVIHKGGERLRMRETLNALEATLDPNSFCRIHRSYLVNVEFVSGLQHMYKGEYVIFLANGKQLTSSRSYKEPVNRLLRHA